MTKPLPEPGDPPRLSAPAADTPLGLREALQAGREDLPSEAALASLAARLAPLMPAPPSGTPPTGAPAPEPTPTPPPVVGSVPPVGGAALTLGVALVVLIVGVGTVSWQRFGVAPRPEPTPEVAVAPVPPAPLVPEVPTPEPEPVQPAVIQPATRSKAAPVPAEAATPTHNLDAELTLLREAQAALRTDPGKALATAASHAERFPNGTLAQEREVVAVQALLALGKREEAERRAATFAARWPESAHRRRLDVVLGGPE